MSKFSEINKIIHPPCQLLAVSKLQSLEKIQDLWQQGQRHFAENYVQEALDKQRLWPKDFQPIHWHMIGHLQTNKVKAIAGKFDFIHSVDSVRLANALAKVTPAGVKQKIFLQVNLAKEETKGGFSEEELPTVLNSISSLESLTIVGLMTMPPLFEDSEKSRPYFLRLRQLRDQWQKTYPDLTELSMGTSADYQIAIQEGATWVRLGTILFGARS